MRFAGRLHSWNEERGFGFIRPVEGGQDIFVHVSALPVPRPGQDEVLTFDVALNEQGKKKAVNVRVQQQESVGLAADQAQVRAQLRRDTGRRPRAAAGRGINVFAVLAIFCVLGWYGYYQYQRMLIRTKAAADVLIELPATPSRAGAATPSGAPTQASSHCDGRTKCSQMTSCEEATFFLRNCPGTQMDGDGDGVPCEQQWCSAGGANPQRRR